jgi:hypothetical protein
LAREAPASADAMRELALFAYRFNRPAETIELLGELDPDRGLMKHCNCYWTILTQAYHMLGEALVHGSGFEHIMVVKSRSGVATDEVSETEPIQVRESPIPDSQLA